jgi:hypothetical protein
MDGKTSKTPIRLGKDPLIEKGRRKNREARKEPKVPESAFRVLVAFTGPGLAVFFTFHFTCITGKHTRFF